ncbi:MAG TPA: hypothetical protein VF290_04470 [Pyrinomonadaceae bacterium]
MRTVAAVLGIFLLCGVVSAQARKPVATRFDQFGKVGHCDLGARLDNFAIQVQNTPGSQANILVYGPDGEGYGTGRYFLELIKDYLVNARGFKPGRVKTIYGGRNTDLTQPVIELWVVPKGAASPEPQKHETHLESFQGLFADHAASDDLGLYYLSEMGPGISETTHASFADILHQQKNATGYIVVYSGEDSAPGAWRRIAQSQIDYFKELKLEANRFKMIFGGHQKETRLQLWLSPDGKPPVPDAGSELPLEKTVKVRDFYPDDLSYERNQKAIFTRLAEILRLEKTVRVFLVVRLEQPDPEAMSPEFEPEAGEPNEGPEPLDLARLVEKWRLELTNTHKIAAERFIVVFAPPLEFDANRMSLWVVPKGQPLPDPNETEEDNPSTDNE